MVVHILVWLFVRLQHMYDFSNCPKCTLVLAKWSESNTDLYHLHFHRMDQVRRLQPVCIRLYKRKLSHIGHHLFMWNGMFDVRRWASRCYPHAGDDGRNATCKKEKKRKICTNTSIWLDCIGKFSAISRDKLSSDIISRSNFVRWTSRSWLPANYPYIRF